MKFAEFARTKNAKDKEPRKSNWNNIRNLAIGGTIGTGLGVGSTIGYNNIGSYLNSRKDKKQELNNNSFKDPKSYINNYR